MHQSAIVQGAFEDVFGIGQSIPAANDTRWNSIYRQVNSIVKLDNNKLTEMLRNTPQQNLVFTQKELQQLKELVDVLELFAQATDIAQGNNYVTASCVVPFVVLLNKRLAEQLSSVKYQIPLVRELQRSLCERFRGLYKQLNLEIPLGVVLTIQSAAKDLQFDSNVYLLACALDPVHGYRWLDNHSGSAAVKEALKSRIISKLNYY